MGTRFDFATAQQILFGAGRQQEVAPLAARLGRCALLVTGGDASRALQVAEDLDRVQMAAIPYRVAGEPRVETAVKGAEIARQAGCDVVIGIGGGSVVDAAKAIAALVTNVDPILTYLEVVGEGRPLTRDPLPYIAVPTTAGTGAEVTRNAVLSVPEAAIKVSLRSPKMLPTAAVVDPELTWSMPADVTAWTGLDALTQLIEPFVSNRAQPLTDGICREGIRRVAGSLREAYRDGTNGLAREGMAVAGLFGGLALANAGLGAVHGFAAPIGGRFSAPHGAVCAALLPHVVRMNLAAIRDRKPDSYVLARYDEVGRLLTGENAAMATEALSWIEETCRIFGVPKLSAYGMSGQDVPEVVSLSRQASSMKGNPIELTDAELTEILTSAL